MDNDTHAENLKTSSELAAALTTATTPDQHDQATPCTDFTVSDVINHLAFGFEMTRRSGVREAWDPDWKPDDIAPALVGVPADQWASVCALEAPRAARAWSHPDSWDGESSMGSAQMPAQSVGSLMTAEFVVHGWDLAAATGRDFDPPADVVQAAITGIEPMLEMGRDGGWYDPAVAIADGAPALHQLLAMTGRDPTWKPARS